MPTDKRQRQRDNRQLKYQQQAKEQRRASTKKRALIGVAAVAGGLALVLFIAWAGGAFDGADDEADTAETIESTLPESVTGFQYGSGECPPADGVAEPVRTFTDAPQLCIDPEASFTATFVTSAGDIVVDLDTASVPGTVNNFVTLARYGYYDDTLIFRADPSIDIVQGGGQTNTDTPGYEIPDEADGFTYQPGQLVMARTQAPDSAGGQWFFTGGPNASALDGQGTYVVFGEVTEGLEIVQDIIASVDTNGPPPEEITVETVTITEAGADAPTATAATTAATTSS